MTLPSGQYRDLVHVQREITSRDAFAGTEKTWVQKWSSIPSRVTPMKGGEEVKTARLAAISNFEITVRSNPATRLIVPSDRLVNVRSGAVYDVQHIADLKGDGRELLLTCRSIK